jgi:hypothetical protein
MADGISLPRSRHRINRELIARQNGGTNPSKFTIRRITADNYVTSRAGLLRSAPSIPRNVAEGTMSSNITANTIPAARLHRE